MILMVPNGGVSTSKSIFSVTITSCLSDGGAPSHVEKSDHNLRSGKSQGQDESPLDAEVKNIITKIKNTFIMLELLQHTKGNVLISISSNLI